MPDDVFTKPVVFGTIVQPENVMGDLLWKKR